MKKTLHLISDSTGQTVANVASATLALYDGEDIEEKLHVFVRSMAEVDAVIAEIKANPGLVFLTMVDQERKQKIISAANDIGRAHHDDLVMITAFSGGFHGGGKFGNDDPVRRG